MNGFYSSVAGATLRWHDFPGDGLPVVFIHGLGCASSYDYPRIASDPALRERRKILIDLPGFGYSDKPRVFSYNIHEQALGSARRGRVVYKTAPPGPSGGLPAA